MKKTMMMALLAGAMVAAVALPGLAGAGRVRATIWMDGVGERVAAVSTNAGDVSFHVDADVSKQSDLYKLWVANKCYAHGELVSAQYQPVHDGMATGFTVSSGMDCTAYVWLFPSSETPLKGASMTYSVQ